MSESKYIDINKTIRMKVETYKSLDGNVEVSMEYQKFNADKQAWHKPDYFDSIDISLENSHNLLRF